MPSDPHALLHRPSPRTSLIALLAIAVSAVLALVIVGSVSVHQRATCPPASQSSPSAPIGPQCLDPQFAAYPGAGH